VLATGGIDLRMTTIAEKLQEAQVETHFYGKWCVWSIRLMQLLGLMRLCDLTTCVRHVGQRSPAHLPSARGFNHSLGFLTGAENHFTQIVADSTYGSKVDLWMNEAPAPNDINGSYGTYIFAEAAIHALRNFSARLKGPDPPRGIFIYQAWQG
jgi:arylsulfatase A-like enzyme